MRDTVPQFSNIESLARGIIWEDHQMLLTISFLDLF